MKALVGAKSFSVCRIRAISVDSISASGGTALVTIYKFLAVYGEASTAALRPFPPITLDWDIARRWDLRQVVALTKRFLLISIKYSHIFLFPFNAQKSHFFTHVHCRVYPERGRKKGRKAMYT